MRINTRIRQLVNDRLALVAQAQEIKQSMRDSLMPVHPRYDYKIVNVRDLSVEQQSTIIRMESKPR